MSHIDILEPLSYLCWGLRRIAEATIINGIPALLVLSFLFHAHGNRNVGRMYSDGLWNIDNGLRTTLYILEVVDKHRTHARPVNRSRAKHI